MDSLPEITQPSDVVTKLTNSLEGLFMQAKSALEYGTHTADEKMRVIAAASKTVIALSKE